MRWRSRDGVLHPGDQEFLTGLKDAELVERTPRGTWALYLMCAVVVVGLVGRRRKVTVVLRLLCWGMGLKCVVLK